MALAQAFIATYNATQDKTTVAPITLECTFRFTSSSHANESRSQCKAFTFVNPLQISLNDWPSHDPSQFGPYTKMYLNTLSIC